MEAKAERRCARCEKLSRAMLKNREGHHSDDAVKKGKSLAFCKKSVLCIAAFRVAALWCTKFWTSQPLNKAGEPSTPLHKGVWAVRVSVSWGGQPNRTTCLALGGINFSSKRAIKLHKWPPGELLGQPVCRTKLPRKVLISKRKMVRKTTRNFPEKF